MKENIKEDIKTVEYNMKCIRNVMNNFEDELCENMQTKTDEVSKIMDNILSDYKRVLKENEELKSKNKILEELLQGNLYELYKYYKELAGSYQGNCIPVQKVKDKIEEIQKDKDNKYYDMFYKNY